MPLVRMWKESLCRTSRERVGKVRRRPWLSGQFEIVPPGKNIKANRAAIEKVIPSTSLWASLGSDAGVPSRAAFWKATCLGATLEATIHAICASALKVASNVNRGITRLHCINTCQGHLRMFAASCLRFVQQFLKLHVTMTSDRFLACGSTVEFSASLIPMCAHAQPTIASSQLACS